MAGNALAACKDTSKQAWLLPRQAKGCPPAAAMEQTPAQQPGPPITRVWPKLAQYLSVVDALAAAQASKAWHHAVTDASPWAPRRIDGAKAAVAACEAAAAAARATANVPHKYRRSRLMDLEDRPAYRNFVSGEVGALSLARILGACSLHGKFVDLGSGTGRPLVYAATLGLFEELIGLELLDGYVRSSRETLAHVECKWSIHQRDFVSDEGAAVWRDADVVFAASTVFDEAQMARIAARAAALKRGARVVTLDVALPSPHFAVEWVVACPDCSWGAARAFVQRRV